MWKNEAPAWVKGYFWANILRPQVPVIHTCTCMLVHGLGLSIILRLHLKLQPKSDSTLLCKQKEDQSDFTRRHENINQHNIQELGRFWPKAASSIWGVVNGSWNQLRSHKVALKMIQRTNRRYQNVSQRVSPKSKFCFIKPFQLYLYVLQVIIQYFFFCVSFRNQKPNL